MLTCIRQVHGAGLQNPPSLQAASVRETGVPNLATSPEDSRLAADKMTTCKEIGIENHGDFFITDKTTYEVKNVINSSVDRGNMTEFWNGSVALTEHTCGILDCTNKAEEGGHVWLRPGARSLTQFCFIMPICKECNNSEKLNKSHKKIKKGVILVARNKKQGME